MFLAIDFSAEKSHEVLIPCLFAPPRPFDTPPFKLIAGISIGGPSGNTDLWIFAAPSASKPPSHQPPSPYQPTFESEKAYSSGPFTASPTVGTSGHVTFATDKPEKAPPVAASHTRSASVPAPAPAAPHRKSVPAMAMPDPMVNKPTPLIANPPMTMPIPSPAESSPRSKPPSPSKSALANAPVPTRPTVARVSRETSTRVKAGARPVTSLGAIGPDLRLLGPDTRSRSSAFGEII